VTQSYGATAAFAATLAGPPALRFGSTTLWRSCAMPFTFQLSRRLARILALMLAATLAVVAGERQRATLPSSVLARVELPPVAVPLDQPVAVTAVVVGSADETANAHRSSWSRQLPLPPDLES
jgi:hypothetical protein